MGQQLRQRCQLAATLLVDGATSSVDVTTSLVNGTTLLVDMEMLSVDGNSDTDSSL